jgi:tRNA modification GTPase
VDAETEAQRRQALAQLDGALGHRHQAWRAALIEILALLEAEIDFPDEDVPDAIAATAGPLIDQLAGELDAAVAGAARGERVRSGYRVALIGAPNAGKSSLLNQLAGREAAIVTPVPGTTRDVIEVPLVLAGYKVLLADTAGVRETAEAIEQEGVRRARAWAHSADLRLLVVDGSGETGTWRVAAGESRAGDLLVLNKADLPSGVDSQASRSWAGGAFHVIEADARTAVGVETLLRVLEQRVLAELSGGEFPAATRVRHETLLSEARSALGRARGGLPLGAELAAAEVHLAAQALARVTGEVDNEAVLDRVFSSFCIGK